MTIRAPIWFVWAVLMGACTPLPVSTRIEWRAGNDITERDRREIVQVVRRLGILHVSSVHRVVFRPGERWGVRVQSPVEVSGDRIGWIAVDVSHAGALDKSDDLGADERPMTVGHWAARRVDIRREERWRIHDGAWHVDVRLAEAVTYADATRIVLAIRRNALVGRPPAVAPWDVTDVDAAAITGIEVARHAAPGYEVTVPIGDGGGIILCVRLASTHVELYDLKWWIVSPPPRANTALHPTGAGGTVSAGG